MRPLEAGIGLTLIAGAKTLLFGRSGWTLVVWLLSATLLVLHATIEGARIQGLPAYLGVLLLLVGLLSNAHWTLRIGAGVLALACGFTGLLAFFLYPILKLPAPEGPFAIGTTTFYLTDHARREHYFSGGGDSRRVVAQVWYPAQKCSGPVAPYVSKADLISRFQRSSYVKTHACTDAPFVTPAKRWPVVLYSPAYGGYRSQTSYITEHLVSHGYMVVGVDHPGTGARIGFPDGFVAAGMPDAWLNLSSIGALEKSKKKAEDVLATDVADMQFVLGQLQETSSDPKLAGLAQQMDVARLAAVGYSFGGSVAAELCRRDERFRAGVDLDGWLFREVVAAGIQKPFLFLIEDDALWFKNEGPYPDNEDGAVRLGTLEYHTAIRRSLNLWGGCVGRMLNASHPDFMDSATELRRWPWQAPPRMRPEALHDAIRRLILAFLDQELYGKQAEFSEVSRQFAKYYDLQCANRGDVAAEDR